MPTQESSTHNGHNGHDAAHEAAVDALVRTGSIGQLSRADIVEAVTRYATAIGTLADPAVIAPIETRALRAILAKLAESGLTDGAIR